MQRRSILVAGSGSLRCAPPILAGLAAYAPDHELEVRLWDADPEMLDLFQRFFAQCLDSTRMGHKMVWGTEPVEAFDGADAVILCVGTRCAKRFLAPPVEHAVEGEEEDEETEAVEAEAEADADTAVRFGYGDRNRPTPRRRLSPHLRHILYHPADDLPRKEAMDRAVNRLKLLVPDHAALLSLIRDSDAHLGRGAHLDWPPALTPAELEQRPHEVLRWVQGEPGLPAYIEQNRVNPVTRWLSQVEGMPL